MPSTQKRTARVRTRRRATNGHRSTGRPSPKVYRARSESPVPGPEYLLLNRVRSGAADRSDLDLLTKGLSWRRIPEQPPERSLLIGPQRLHVIMVGWEFPPSHSGGLGVHSFELCKELTRMGHRVTFLSPFSGPFTAIPGVTFRHPGDAVDDSPWYPPAYWTGEAPGSPFQSGTDGYNAWVAELPTPQGADTVHVHDWFGTVGGSRLARRLRVPLVLTIHSTEYDRSLDHPWEHILQREQFGVDQADRIIAVSNHLRRELIERYHAPPSRVRVIYNAVRPSPRLAPLEQSRQVVLYLGRLAAMKGVDTFLRATARIIATMPDTLFVVAGEGPEYPHLLTLAAHLGLSDRVLFLGHVTEEERVVLLASASVFVLPSIVEPFGIAALEAMAAGVPTIVSKTSGVAEIARSVFTVDFWDVDEFASRIAEILEYPELRFAMSEEGRREAVREGWAERALQTVGVYQEARQSYRRPVR